LARELDHDPNEAADGVGEVLVREGSCGIASIAVRTTTALPGPRSGTTAAPATHLEAEIERAEGELEGGAGAVGELDLGGHVHHEGFLELVPVAGRRAVERSISVAFLPSGSTTTPVARIETILIEGRLVDQPQRP
jgi:hypothetical protein